MNKTPILINKIFFSLAFLLSLYYYIRKLISSNSTTAIVFNSPVEKQLKFFLFPTNMKEKILYLYYINPIE